MRAERARSACRITVVCESILPDVLLSRGDTGKGVLRNRHQWIAVSRTANHRRAEFFGLGPITVCLLKKKLPEATNVLAELAHHQIRAVAPHVLPVRRVFCRQQRFARDARVGQWPFGVFAVVVPISQ